MNNGGNIHYSQENYVVCLKFRFFVSTVSVREDIFIVLQLVLVLVWFGFTLSSFSQRNMIILTRICHKN